MLDIAEVAAYLSIIILLFYFAMELSKPKSGAQTWVTLAFIAVLIGVVGYYLWLNYYKQKSSPSESAPDNPIEQEQVPEEPAEPEDPIALDYSPVERDFVILNKKKVQINQITYEDFKFYYLSPEFLEKFNKATKISLQLKRNRLIEERTRILKDLDVLKKGVKPRHGLAGMMRDLDRHDDSKILEETVEKIECLIDEAKELESKLTIERSRANLISALTDPKMGIDSLIGMQELKDFLAKKLYTFANNPRLFCTSFQNIRLYGPAGIGKTKAAQVIGHVYATSGILIRNHVQKATSSELTTAYVNESSKRTKKLLLSNLESVVFIDEAYGLSPPQSILGDGHDHGHEAITEMVNLTDKILGLIVVIVAGYEKEMEERFMKANQGIPSRFPIKILLPPYSSRELTQILEKNMKEASPKLKVSKDQGNFMYTLVHHVNRTCPEAFENQGRDMLNLSGHIGEAISGSPGQSWERCYEQMIMDGMNSFLAMKGRSVEQME